jgi:hypothetical protein
MNLNFPSLPNRLSLWLVIALMITLCLPLQGLDIEQNAAVVVSGLVDSLLISNPVVLDIRCGEWTPALEREMRVSLLSKGIDLREANIVLVKENADTLSTDAEDIYAGKQLLESLNLQRADLLELSLEQTIETGEKRSFFSYARYNTPSYRFELKQIALPEQRLIAMREFKLSGNPEIENPGSLLAMKWYEPIIACAVLGSMVLMLWTLK